jgi:hypothetical protein
MKAIAFGLLAVFATACADSSLTVDNESSFALEQIQLAPVDQVTWGPNLLRGDILAPGEALQIDQIDCNTYDVHIISEAGQECVVSSLDLCFDNARWVIDNTELAHCSF